MTQCVCLAGGIEFKHCCSVQVEEYAAAVHKKLASCWSAVDSVGAAETQAFMWKLRDTCEFAS